LMPFSLGTGSHTFMARAKDSLNVVDPTPASVTWNVDATGPVVTNVTGPTNPTTSTDAHFTFTLTDASSIVEIHCQLDSGSDTVCGSSGSGSVDYSSLPTGSHTFNVYGVDSFGNVGSTSSYPW